MGELDVVGGGEGVEPLGPVQGDVRDPVGRDMAEDAFHGGGSGSFDDHRELLEGSDAVGEGEVRPWLDVVVGYAFVPDREGDAQLGSCQVGPEAAVHAAAEAEVAIRVAIPAD